MDLTSLNGFLSGYLHQDWDTEYAGADQAARDFARTEPVATVHRTMAEIDRLLDVGMPEDDLGAWLLSVGCHFRPASSFREWLVDMKRVMAANLTER